MSLDSINSMRNLDSCAFGSVGMIEGSKFLVLQLLVGQFDNPFDMKNKESHKLRRYLEFLDNFSF